MSDRAMRILFLATIAGVLAFPTVSHAGPVTVMEQDYDNFCRFSHVPLPPPWGDSCPDPNHNCQTNPWIFNGYLETDTAHGGILATPQAELFSSLNQRGYIYYYVSTNPDAPGLCMAVQRVDVGPVGLGITQDLSDFAVICQGANGTACFWDTTNDGYPSWQSCNGSTNEVFCPNNFNGTRVFDYPIHYIASQSLNSNEVDYNSPSNDKRALLLTNTDFSIWEDIGFASLATCTDCHAGDNVFINHPETATDLYGLNLVPRNLWFPTNANSNWPDPVFPQGNPDFLASPGPDGSVDNQACQQCHSANLTSRPAFLDGGRFPLRDSVHFQRFGSVLLNTTLQRALVPDAPFPKFPGQSSPCNPFDPISGKWCPNGAMPPLAGGYNNMMEEWSSVMYDTHSKDPIDNPSGIPETNPTFEHFSWTSDGLGRGQLSSSPYTTTMWNYKDGYCFVSKLNPGHAANDIFVALDANNNYVLSGLRDTTTGHARARIDAICAPWASLNASSSLSTPGQVWNPGAEPSFPSGFPGLPAPQTGSAALFSAHVTGTHSRSFTASPTTMPASTNLAAGDQPYLWVNLTTGDAPTEIMLELTATDGSVNRVYWGTSNPIGLTARNVGTLPASGSWKKLATPASNFQPTIAGKRMNGLKIYFFGGSGYVDDVGYLLNGGAEQNWFDDEIPAGAVIGAPGSGETGDGWIWAMKPGVGWSNASAGTGTITTTLPVKGWALCQIAGLNGVFPSSGTAQNITLSWPMAASGIFSNSGTNWVLKQTASTSTQRTATMCVDLSLKNAWSASLSSAFGFTSYSQTLDSSLTQAASNTTTDLTAPFSFRSPNLASGSICSIQGASGLVFATGESQPTASIANVDNFMDGAWAARTTSSPGSWFTTCYETVGGPSNRGGWFASSPGLRINCGDNGAIPPFIADTDFSGGAGKTRAVTISLSGVVNPAPVDVYKSQHYASPFTYTIPGFTAGSSHLIRLHFAETNPNNNGPNKRKFSVAINGTTQISNLDLWATVGLNHAYIKEFTLAANSSGQYVLSFSASLDSATISGIEVL
jgi:hypothetical protein